jgi:ketosteroid isomerase-like protein
MPASENAVAEVLAAYSAARNSSDTNAVMSLYAEDGVSMPL